MSKIIACKACGQPFDIEEDQAAAERIVKNVAARIAEASDDPEEVEADEAPEYRRETVNAMFNLDDYLRQLTSEDWPEVIAAVGITRFREIVAALQAACDEHCAVESAADQAVTSRVTDSSSANSLKLRECDAVTP